MGGTDKKLISNLQIWLQFPPVVKCILKSITKIQVFSELKSHIVHVMLLRGGVHIHVVRQNVILTFLVGGWVSRKPV